MAIYWVDPYINSANGGIHGTTGSGSGTYASPWTCTDLADTTTMGSLVSGDEIRFKGLPEDTFFDTQYAFSNTNGTGTTTNYYDVSNTYNKLIRLKAADGTIYYCGYNGWGQLPTVYGTSTWYSANPIQYPGYGYYVCNANYHITSGSSSPMFAGLTGLVTVTSGWTSETAQDGITVIAVTDSTPFGSTLYFGTTSSDTAQRNLKLDCDRMIIATISSNVGLTIAANSVKLKAAMIGEYYPAGYFKIYSGTNASTTAGSGTLELGSCSTGSWCNFYSYGVGQTSVSIGISTVGYQPSLQLNSASGGNAVVNLNLKKLYSYSNWSLSANTSINWSAPAGWSYEWKTGNGFYIIGSGAITESFGTPAAQAFSGTIYNSFGYVSQPATNASPTSVNTSFKFYSTAGSYLKKGSFSQATKSWASRLLIETSGETLDTLTVCPASCSATAPYGSSYKVNIMVEPVSKKRVQLMSPTSAGDCALVFNSPANSDKLTWRLFGSGNGKVYADTFSLPFPTYSTGGLQFNSSFTTSGTPGITLVVKLYGLNTLNGSVTSLGDATTTVSGTAITASKTLSQATLNNSNIGNIFAVVDVTKTSTANCSLVFNSMTVTAL